MRPRAAASLWVSSCVGCTEAKGREALDGRYVVGAACLLRLYYINTAGRGKGQGRT